MRRRTVWRRALAGAVAVAASAASMTLSQPTPAHAAPTPFALAWSRIVTGRIHLSAPLIADVDGDGQNEIVVGDLEGLVHVFKGDGTGELPGWPQYARPDGVHPTAVESSPAIADLDGDGRKEIIVGATSAWIINQPGGLVVFDAHGHLRWHWQGNDLRTIWFGNHWGADGYSEGAAATPAVADVNGDGHPDIVFGTFEAKLHVLDRYGHELRGFPYDTDDAVWSSASVFDVDHDGRAEIFFGSGSTGGGPQPHMGGTVYGLKWTPSGVVTMWRKNLPESVDASPAIADINHDGYPDVVTTTSDAFMNTATRSIFAWRAIDGATVPGYPVDTGAVTIGSPAVGDLNGDGRPDVVVGSWDGHARAYDGHGNKIWDVNVFAGGVIPAQKIEGSPIIADLNGDGRNDVAIPSNFGAYLLDGRTGALLNPVLELRWSMQNAPAVGIVGGRYRLVLAGFQYGPPYSENDPRTLGGVFVHDLASTTATNAWPAWRRTPTRTGSPAFRQAAYGPNQCAPDTNPPSHPNASSGAGYRVAYRDGVLRSFGSIPPVPGMAHRAYSPVMAAADDPTHDGTWLLGFDGSVYATGTAHYYGSALKHGSPAMAIVGTATGNGYWVMLADGRIYSFGDAVSHGNAYRHAPLFTGLGATPSGGGYWDVAANGAVHPFGDAALHGSLYGVPHSAIMGIAPTGSGQGYWVVSAAGGVAPFGDAVNHGSMSKLGLCVRHAAIGVARSADDGGYWVLASDGSVYAFGDAIDHGSRASRAGAAAIISG